MQGTSSVPGPRPRAALFLLLVVAGLTATAARAGTAYVSSSTVRGGVGASFHSEGRSNQLRRMTTGAYEVVFPGVGTGVGGGHVQISDRGTAEGHCKVRRWTRRGDDVSVFVDCYDDRGSASDRRFTALFQQHGDPVIALRGGSLAYLWADRPTASRYTPNTTYQASTDGRLHEIRRMGVGRYRVTMALGWRPHAIGMKVTAYGTDAVRCEIGEPWGAEGFGLYDFEVECRGPGGPADSRFTAHVSHGTSPIAGTHALTWHAYHGVWATEGSAIDKVRVRDGLWWITLQGPAAQGELLVDGIRGESCRVAARIPAGPETRFLVACGSDATLWGGHLIQVLTDRPLPPLLGEPPPWEPPSPLPDPWTW